jgi:hypothetical protein
MKKFLVLLTMFFVFAVVVPTSTYALGGGNKYGKSFKKHNKSKRYRSNYNSRNSNRRYSDNDRGYYNQNYRRGPSVYQRHRNLINIGIGAGSGAIIGGILGGKRGALIGAGVGAGAGAAYTYGIRPKNRRYYGNNRRRN